MIRIGRYTAALGVIAIGILLILDHIGVLDSLAVIGNWWPALILAFGVELILIQAIYRDPGQRLRFDFGGFIGAVVLCGFVLVATQGSQFKFAWLPQWFNGIVHQYSDESGLSFDKGKTIVTLNDNTRKVSVKDGNGRIILKQGPVSQIEIDTVVYVSGADASEAEEIARQSSIEVQEGENIEISANGKPYGMGNLRKPRMNLTVTLPERTLPELDINLDNGGVELQPLRSDNLIELDVKNGEVTGGGVDGRLNVIVYNGKIKLSQLKGETALETMNGSIQADRVEGTLNADTKNGSIVLNEVFGSLSAETVNGSIDIATSKVGGSWNVKSVMGDLVLAWPEGASVRVDGESSFGDFNTVWPFTVQDHRITGSLGDGTHRISLDTHGDISLRSNRP